MKLEVDWSPPVKCSKIRALDTTEFDLGLSGQSSAKSAMFKKTTTCLRTVQDSAQVESSESRTALRQWNTIISPILQKFLLYPFLNPHLCGLKKHHHYTAQLRVECSMYLSLECCETLSLKRPCSGCKVRQFWCKFLWWGGISEDWIATIFHLFF